MKYPREAKKQLWNIVVMVLVWMLWCIKGDENSMGPFQCGLIHNGNPWPVDHIQVLLTPLSDPEEPRIPAGDPRLTYPCTPHTTHKSNQRVLPQNIPIKVVSICTRPSALAYDLGSVLPNIYHPYATND